MTVCTCEDEPLQGHKALSSRVRLTGSNLFSVTGTQKTAVLIFRLAAWVSHGKESSGKSVPERKELQELMGKKHVTQ